MQQPLIQTKESKNNWINSSCILTLILTLFLIECFRFRSQTREASVGKILAGSVVKELVSQHTGTVQEILDHGKVRLFDEDTQQSREVSMENIVEMRPPSAASMQSLAYPPHTGGPSKASLIISEHNPQIETTKSCAREKNVLSQMNRAYVCECGNGYVRIGNHKGVGKSEQWFSRWVPVTHGRIECSLEALGIPKEQDPTPGSWKICECGREKQNGMISLYPEVVPAESTWPYLKKLREDPWYTESGCKSANGVLSMCGSHKCSEGYFAFHRRITSILQQPILSKTFRNENGAPGESLVRQFLSYMVKLLSDPHNRLILISVIPEHTFLVEQNVKFFRIYQSWDSSFDLRYWIDRDVLPGDLCEPGEKVARALQSSDQAQLAELARAGIQDDRISIQEARDRFGGLRDLQQRDIEGLCMAISHGFILEEMRTKRGVGSLFPASMTLSRNADTKPFLGKNVLNLIKLQDGSPFDIEVSFMQEKNFEKDYGLFKRLHTSNEDDMQKLNLDFLNKAEEMELPTHPQTGSEEVAPISITKI